MLNNDESYVLTDRNGGIEECEMNGEIAYDEVLPPNPSKILYQTIASIMILIGLILISSSNASWLKWSRRQLHQAVNASTKNTYGIIIDSDLVKKIMAAGSNLIEMEEITKQIQGLKTTPYEDETFQNWVWPVQGSLSKQFGWQNDKDEKKSYNSGVQIVAPNGANIYAVANGRIEMITSDNNGQIVIINHSNGWKSIYHNLELIQVQVGQYVKSGNIIAQLSKDSSVDRSELLFEITRDGQPIDPLMVLVNN